VKNPFLIGTKIYLRPLEIEDVDSLVTWFNDTDVTRFLLRYRPLTRMEEEAFLRKISESDTDIVLGIAVRENDRLVGFTGLNQLDVRNRHVRFGIGLGDKSTWGKGYGTEATRLMVRYAFDTLNLHRVWLHVSENNERGLRTYQKVGFQTEGRLRQDTYREGRYWDTIVMAILREEWGAGDSV
jgi:RimJ/RimL family protein N-acetyltransferase